MRPRPTVGRLDCALPLTECRTLTGDALPAVLWRRADTGRRLAAMRVELAAMEADATRELRAVDGGH